MEKVETDIQEIAMPLEVEAEVAGLVEDRDHKETLLDLEEVAGGSGYIGGVTGGSMSSGQRSGNGYATITLVE